MLVPKFLMQFTSFGKYFKKLGQHIIIIKKKVVILQPDF